MLTEERKVVTVLFCDLVDFTASADGADPEDVRARLSPYHARVREEIERYGGTVEKFIGDAVMAVYGAPTLHEDDAERAVRSALRVLEAIGDLNDERPGLELQVRVGIATGEALVTLGARPEAGEAMVAGDVVNTAARLQAAAPAGGIAVDEPTHRATAPGFEYQELEPAMLKGKTTPVALWRPLAARSRMGSVAAKGPATPLVGRDLERRLVIDAFERAVAERMPQLVTIVGEPGVGKSRMVGELFAHIDAPAPELVRWRVGRCLPYGEGVTFWALGEIVKAEMGILESDSEAAALAKLDAAIPEGPDREWLRQRLLPLVGLEAASTAERDELFTAWRRYLESLAADGPSVLVFEDLHWADEAMLAFLEHLADWAEGVPMLLLATARPELFERHPTWAAAARNSTRLNLTPLSASDTARLIGLLLDQAVLPADVQALILEQSGGNPLYAEEFVRLLRDRGLLVGEKRIVALAEGAEIPFPESVHALIGARLDTLTPERKAILHDAAVIGKVFWAGGVAAMGGLPTQTVTEALHELSRKELVRRMRSTTMAGEEEYTFWHVLVRDVAYGQIPRVGRAERHRRAAAWIESVAGERAEDEAEILAHHYTTALELAAAAGATDVGDLKAAALRFLTLAGQRALSLDAVRAEEHFARALAFTPPGHPQRPELLVDWADALRAADRQDEASEALGEAIAAFREQDEAVAAARALTMLSNVRWQLGDPRSREPAVEAVALLQGLAATVELVEAYAEVSRQEHLAGEYQQSIASGERALELARALGLGESAKALHYVGASRTTLGDARGFTEMRRSADLARVRGQALLAAIMTNNLADATAQTESITAALALYREVIEYAERRGIAEVARWSSVEAAGQMVRAGLLDDAFALAERTGERLEGRLNALVRSLAVRAVVLAYRGREEDALPLVDEAIATASTTDVIEGFILAHQIGALVHFSIGDRLTALELLGRLLEKDHAAGAATYSFHLPDAIRSAVGSGDVELAERLADVPTPMLDEENAVHAARAIIAEARGQLADAAELYEEAARRWERAGVVTERAFALLGQGRCLVTLSRSAEAQDPLRRARELFASMRMAPALAETDALLEKAISLAS